MAKRNKAAFFHPHRSIFVEMVREDLTRQQARALWHRMFKAREGVNSFPRKYRTAYNAASRVLTMQMRQLHQQHDAAA